MRSSVKCRAWIDASAGTIHPTSRLIRRLWQPVFERHASSVAHRKNWFVGTCHPVGTGRRVPRTTSMKRSRLWTEHCHGKVRLTGKEVEAVLCQPGGAGAVQSSPRAWRGLGLGGRDTRTPVGLELCHRFGIKSLRRQ
jgi:hypothetical protein